ncbi:MAG: phospho-N-acetylmuramoyl-pentapeptide-transferase [Chloroflexi bacterium]|nr:phospho-N-acetylmuramoyl-pentapeptide-transferase [Chloroflexota bacterium]
MSHALGVAGFTFIVAFLAGYPLLRALRRLRIGKQIRSDGPYTHLQKMGTPTMGGVLIWASVFVSTALFNVLNSFSIVVPLVATAVTGVLGTIDDVVGMLGKDGQGLTVRMKFVGLTVISIGIAIAIYGVLQIDYIYIPTIQTRLQIGTLLIPVAALAIMATANAVNLTDGLDSLAGMCAAAAFTSYGIIAHLQDQAPLATFCFTVVGALLAFLWFNAYPATLMMGDAGSLSLGAALATVALMTGHVLLLPIIGFVFVAEALSVILQVSFFKLTRGRRLFRMSPLHHHFEILGWSETHVAQRFWLMSMVAGMIGVALALI